jgi:hypothetical protein
MLDRMPTPTKVQAPGILGYDRAFYFRTPALSFKYSLTQPNDIPLYFLELIRPTTIASLVLLI